MRKKPDILLVLVVVVVAGVILSNLVIANAPQPYNNKALMSMQQSEFPDYRP